MVKMALNAGICVLSTTGLNQVAVDKIVTISRHEANIAVTLSRLEGNIETVITRPQGKSWWH